MHVVIIQPLVYAESKIPINSKLETYWKKASQLWLNSKSHNSCACRTA